MADVRLDETPRRIRVHFGGEIIADSLDAVLAFVAGRHPEYLLPAEHVKLSGLRLAEEVDTDLLGRFTPICGGERRVGRRYLSGPADGFVQLDFEAMDGWFEEEEQIWAHPRDPYRRVDVIESSRRVEILIGGRTVAVTNRPRLVTETGLPERWYVPRADVDWAVLEQSETLSTCQYKGVASWFNVAVPDTDPLTDVAWAYERPISEAPKLAGLVAFYAEHAAVTTLVDGVEQPKPVFEPAWLNPGLAVA